MLAIDGIEVPLTGLAVGDPAYLLDIAAAGAAALAAGAKPDAIVASASEFRPGRAPPRGGWRVGR